MLSLWSELLQTRNEKNAVSVLWKYSHVSCALTSLENKEIDIICRIFYKERMLLFNVCVRHYQSFIREIKAIDRKLGIDHRQELIEETHGNIPVLWRTKYENLLGLPSFAAEAS